jgi:hypothetical protein
MKTFYDGQTIYASDLNANFADSTNQFTITADTVALDTTKYLAVTVDGTACKIALVTV